MITPVLAVADHIHIRTEEFLKKLGMAVSMKPIVMRVEYAFCPNLTIIDTPGFILKVQQFLTIWSVFLGGLEVSFLVEYYLEHCSIP